MPLQLFTNNAVSKLASGITNVATSLTVATGEGAKFPTPVSGQFFLLTLYQLTGTSEGNHEIVKVTARSGDTMTIQRAQESTTAQPWSADTPVELRTTAGALNLFASRTLLDEYDNGNSGTSKAIDWGKGVKQMLTLTGDVGILQTYPADGAYTFQLRAIQDGTGGRTITFFNVNGNPIIWEGGVTPTVEPSAGRSTIFTFQILDGRFYGSAKKY